MASAGAGAAVSELPRRLDHAWRVFGTGLSFVAFGLGGLLLGVLVMPVLLLMRDPVARRRRARRVVQVAFASHLRLMRGLGVMTYEIEGGERLQRDGLLVLANHPTLIDVVCLISLLPNADCVVKRPWPATRSCAVRYGPPATSPMTMAPAWSMTAWPRCMPAAPWSSSRRAPAACPGSRRACSAGPPTSPYGAASTSPRCGSPAARQP